MSEQIPLGRATAYPEHYSPDLLYAIARTDSRAALGLGPELPFHGVDIWNAWELTWLNPAGQPQVATAEISVPADSPNIIESKSLKLYLGSFAMTGFEAIADVAAAIARDLSGCAGAKNDVRLQRPARTARSTIARLPGHCIDALSVSCDAYEVDAGLLRADASDVVSEDLHSHLLRSLCPVTNQPDMGSLMVSYKGPRIDREGLLRYIVSYRRHNDFHEACVERMFVDILHNCAPERLAVYARYQRRGGIDINPFRSNREATAPNIRLWRQ
ncbi:MAG: NADPH-dependent 7-cyano-7-deazaguanine reductase QueF [Gammaproteobacteria bacterium]|nr:NADPH-dependent 7-cyano-7-deazaguanine reductase QueF [Gammaproteobacteria bacterium]MDH3751444.1 NADPH-dependent 7-cyano-7-deazaguanine reductase QueF [Gammaproteobacteria bacterium]MDH3804395.1 NADPH-dependent 7-cyano-7-deazaguanine reductase QueF [Gammaproteobacteria bacterium]